MELLILCTRSRKLSTALAAALMLSGCMLPGEIRPTIGQQMETGVNGLAIWFRQLAPNVWQHASYLDMPGFGASRATV